MERTPTGSEELAISPMPEYPVVEDGTYEATYNGFKPFAEDTAWGPKQGARLMFKITRGKFANQTVSFKGNFFQDSATGRHIIGMRSKLAEVIRVITGGTETINKSHIGTRVIIQVKTKESKKTGKRYANVDAVLQFPVGDQDAKQYTPQPQQVAQTAPAQTQMQATQPAQTQAQQPAQKSALLDDLSDLADFK
jgi:hypothetical protein